MTRPEETPEHLCSPRHIREGSMAPRTRSEEEKADLRRRLDEFSFWYHNIDLGDGIFTSPDHTHGDYPRSRWEQFGPWIPSDLRGYSVLDLGCNAGYFSLQLRKRGAHVVGIDEVPGHIQQAKLAARELGVFDIDYRCMSVYDIDRLRDVPQHFDMILFLGVFYHLRHPLLMLDKLSLLRPGRMFFQTLLKGDPGEPSTMQPDYPLDETKALEDRLFPRMYFVERSFGGDPTNWWLPTESAVMAMLRSSGFTQFERISGSDVFVCESPTCLPVGDLGVVAGR